MMASLEQFHFLRPLWLFALIPLVILLWLMIKKRLGSRSWESICDESLLPYVLIGRVTGKTQRTTLLTALGGLLTIVALAGPAWEKLPQPVFSNKSSLVIALDLSRSMDANDVSPSRLIRARFKIADILKQRGDGQTALLVYAGDSFTVTPLTDDIGTITSQLKALATDIMPVQGNRTELALERAQELLKQAGATSGDILLITDEVNPVQIEKQLAQLKRHNYRLSILGVGTEHGVPVPMADGGFLKDKNGKIVVPVLEEESMRFVAQTGRGKYIRIGLGDEDTETLQRFFSGYSVEGEIKASELQTDVWREQGPWLVLALLPLVALLFRRGYLVALVFLLLPVPEQARASGWQDLWLRPGQQAKRALDAGDHEKAAALFQDPAWKGSALYRAGRFEDAVQSLQQADGIEDLYNQGNALARLGRYQEAIAIYEKVIEQVPDHEDALYNKELLERELEQQNQQQSNQDSDDKDQEQQQSEQNENQKQQSQEDQSRQQDKKDSEQQNADNTEQQSPDQAQQEQNQQQQKQQAEADQQQDQQNDELQEQQFSAAEQMTSDEQQQATEQWLRRIPDDPAGLLRRKFRYQYQQRSDNRQSNDKNW